MHGQVDLVLLAELLDHVERLGGWLGHKRLDAHLLGEVERLAAGGFGGAQLRVEVRHAHAAIGELLLQFLADLGRQGLVDLQLGVVLREAQEEGQLDQADTQ